MGTQFKELWNSQQLDDGQSVGSYTISMAYVVVALQLRRRCVISIASAIRKRRANEFSPLIENECARLDRQCRATDDEGRGILVTEQIPSDEVHASSIYWY